MIMTAAITSNMSKQLPKNQKKWLLFGLLILQTAFIFGNSMVSAQDSGALSGGIMLLLRKILDPSGRLDPELLHYVIRKLAHFSEFFLLSCLYLLLCRQLSEAYRTRCTLLAPFAGLLTAVIDEFIQSFSGRGSLVSDVLIDICGVMTAVLLFWLIPYIRQKQQKR